MNKVILMGRLTKDVSVTKNGETAVGRYTLAVDRKGVKEGAEITADYPNCVVFGKMAEFAEKYFKKGTKVVIEGRLQTSSYTNKEGQKVYTTDVVVESQEFAESKKADSAPQSAAAEDDEELPFA